MNDYIEVRGHKIRTAPRYLSGWYAVLDNYDYAPDSPRHCMGFGTTEAEAINELVDMVEEL